MTVTPATPTAAPPTPVISQSDPSTGNVDAMDAEAQAQQLTSASLTAYGSLPNPQMAFEAITTGATPTIASVIMAGNPLFAAELAGAPAGSTSLASPYPTVPSKINDPSQSLWDFNPTTYQKGLSSQLSQSQNASWRSFGQVPEMNFGWMQSVRSGSSADTKKWQNLLKQKGFYQGQNYQVSGVWDQSTEAAFQGFMIQWATPYALFSTDATTKGNATMFLNGLGFDASTLEGSIGRDPSTLAQVAQGWMAAQGPDSSEQTDQKSELQAYSDAFGLAALPDSYQAILQTGTDPLSMLRNGLNSIPLLGSLPVVGGVYHAATNLLTGNLDFAHLTQDPRVAEAQKIDTEMKTQDNLSQADVDNLAPALQSVQDDAGFLGFMNTYDNARTTGILTIWDTLKEGITKGKWENPFDPMSTPRIEAAVADNSLAAGLFGQSWATDNPVWATMFNMATNMADDPTMYIPLLGESELYYRTLGKAGAMRTASRLIGDDSTMKAFNDVTADTMRGRVNQGIFNTARTAYGQGTIHDGQLAQMFAINGTGGARDVEKLAAIKKVMVEPDQHKAWDLFANGDPEGYKTGFGWAINSGKGVFNAHANFKALSQIKSQTLLGRARMIGGFNVSREWSLKDPAGLSGFLGNMGTIVGLEPAEIAPSINAMVEAALHDPDNVMDSYQAVVDQIMQKFFSKPGVNKADFDKWVGDAVDHVVSYAPNAITGEEQSYVLTAAATAGKSDNETASLQAQLLNAQQRLRLAHASGLPEEDLAAIRKEITDIARPAPGFTTQFADKVVFPYSPYEMVAYQTKGLRNITKIQRQVGLDRTMDAWRRITIGKVSTGMRMDVGDDMIRPFAFLVGHNQFGAAFSYLTASIGKMFGLLVPGVHGGIQRSIDDAVEMHPELGTVLQTTKKIMQDTSTDIHRAIEPTGVGYAKALGDEIRYHWAVEPMSQAWLQAFKEGDPTASLNAVTKLVKDSLATAPDPTIGAALRNYRAALKKAEEIPATGDVDADSALKVTQTGARQAAMQEYRKAVGQLAPSPDMASATAQVRGWARARKLHLAPDLIEPQVKEWSEWMEGYMADPTIRKMATIGHVNEKELARLVRDHANTPHRLPIINARLDNPFSNHMLMHLADKVPNAVFENFTGPAINSARTGAFPKMMGYFEQQMRKYFSSMDDPRYGTQEFEQEIAAESASRAIDWIINNTYQGTRTVMGSTMRNIFPFWGATANMDRFYLRQAMASPYIGSAVLHGAEASQQAQSPANANSPGITGLQGLLSHIGFGAGAALQINPLHAFFLTSDGIGSLVPGTGPMFAPLWKAASLDPGFAQILADLIPGASDQIDFNTGQAKPQWPYLADLLSGASMMALGQNVIPSIPGLTNSQDSINSQINSAVQEWERTNNRALSPTDPDYNSIMAGIQRQVGLDLTGQGVAQFTLPMDPYIVNQQQQNTATDLDNWRAAPDDKSRDQILLASLPGVTNAQWQAALIDTPGAPSVPDLLAKDPKSDAALMAYMDSRVSEADRDTIANNSPWVVSASQSKFQTANLGPDEPDRPFDLPQWQLMRNLGDITYLSPSQFVGQVANERDINTGWLEYDNLKNQEYTAMVQNGWTTSSPQYTAWNEAYFQPQLLQIQNNHPAWWTQFGASGSTTTAADLAAKTRPLRTLQTWEVLPQHSDFETQQTTLWRNALQLTDNAAGQIYSLKAGGGSAAEQSLVMQSLQENLQALASQDPTFAAMLAGYSFADWEDIVTLEADEMQANQAAGYPAQVGTQGTA